MHCVVQRRGLGESFINIEPVVSEKVFFALLMVLVVDQLWHCHSKHPFDSSFLIILVHDEITYLALSTVGAPFFRLRFLVATY